MKLIKLKHSILLLRVNTKTDIVECYFAFCISWNCFKSETTNFDFAVINMAQIKAFYKNLANDWTRKYRI
jgi:hypothetical protein